MCADRNSSCPWADRKWNVLLGCTPVSDGCKHCSAAVQAYRQALCPAPADYAGLTYFNKRTGPAFTGEVRFREHKLNEPRKLHGKRIWVAPMSDPFHPDVPDETIARYFSVIADTPDNTYVLLTKRVERMLELYTSGVLHGLVQDILGRRVDWPLHNTWEGVSIEEEKTAKARLDMLVEVPSYFPWVSIQPLLWWLGDVRPQLAKTKYAVLGNETGPLCRPVPKDALFDALAQLRDAGVPHYTYCYPR